MKISERKKTHGPIGSLGEVLYGPLGSDVISGEVDIAIVDECLDLDT